MNKIDRELIDEMMKGIRAEIKAKDDIIMLRLGQILEQTTKTNGRVSNIEAETAIWRWFERHPARFIAVWVVIISLSAIGGIELALTILQNIV